MYINKAIILGNLTRDPELKSTASGTSICTFSLATNRQGKETTEVEYHNVVVFNKQAENAAQYLVKGQQALVEGRIQTRSWEDKDGQKRSRTEVVADFVTFGRKPEKKAGEAATEEKSDELEAMFSSSSEPEINPSDIPF